MFALRQDTASYFLILFGFSSWNFGFDGSGFYSWILITGGVGTVQELKREMHGLIAARTNFNLAEILDYGGKTFLSDDIAIMIIQEAREAFRKTKE